MDVHAYSGETTQELQRNMSVSSASVARPGHSAFGFPESTTNPPFIEDDGGSRSNPGLPVGTQEERPSWSTPIWIAHRGNTRGPKPEKENQPEYILQAIQEGFDVEIDVWGKPTENGIELWLGHDNPQYQINLSFLTINEERLWCHAKNFHALTFLIQHGFHTFSHDKDTHVLTSRGVIWAYVGKEIDHNTICVMPERTPPNTYSNIDLHRVKGICTDYIWLIKNVKDMKYIIL